MVLRKTSEGLQFIFQVAQNFCTVLYLPTHKYHLGQGIFLAFSCLIFLKKNVICFLRFQTKTKRTYASTLLTFFFLNLLLLYYVLLLKVPTVVFPLQAHQLLVPVLTAVLFRQLITFSFLSVGQRQRISKPSVTIATFVRATHHPTFLTQATELTS